MLMIDTAMKEHFYDIFAVSSDAEEILARVQEGLWFKFQTLLMSNNSDDTPFWYFLVLGLIVALVLVIFYSYNIDDI